MRVSRVVIKNFRSIKELDFEPGPLCTLIGENNAGKSTILRALNLVLGELWPNERSFDEEDFHNRDTDTDIVIQVYFDGPWDEERGGRYLKVAGFELSCHALKRAGKDKGAGELDVSFVCIGPKGGRVKNPPPGYRGQGFAPDLPVTRQMRERVPLLYVDVMREYARHQPSSRWSMLRRLIDQISASFKTDKTQISVVRDDGTTAKMSREAAYDFYTKKAFEVLRTKELAELEGALEKNALEQMGLDPADGEVRLGFAGYDPASAFRNLELMIEQLGITSRAQEVGAGLQSAIVVAIFRTYEELRRGGAIFAIEEPEAFLHPQKARYFADILERVSTAGNQVLVATHSPFFAKLHAPETIGLVRRTTSGGTRVVQASGAALAPDLKAGLKIQSQVHAERSELLFARRVLFVEGQTERIAMPFVFAAMGVDANREGISVVDCGSKDSIPFFSHIAKAFDIPFVVMADLDPAKPQQATQKLQAVCPATDLFLLSPDFEGLCGYAASDKIVDAYKHFSGLKARQIPQPIQDVVNRLLAL